MTSHEQCVDCESLDNFLLFQVTGDSVYNLSGLAELETDKSDRPLDPPPKIISVEVGSCHASKSL